MHGERGAALLITIFAMLLLSAVGAVLVLTSTADALIAANAGATSEAFYAATAAFERTLAELRDVPDLTPVLNGALTSRFLDGPPGVRRLPDGTSIDLPALVNLANCQRSSGCSVGDLDAPLRDRPWGPRNPRWRLFAHGPLDAGGSMPNSGIPPYLVVMVADDPAETDVDPWSDGLRTTASANPGAGIVLVRAEAYGRRGARRVIEGATVRLDLASRALWDAADPAVRGPAPSSVPVLQVRSWREVL